MSVIVDGIESREGVEYVKIPPDVLQIMADLPARRQQDAFLGAYVRHFLGLPVGKVPRTIEPAFRVASRIADRITVGIVTGGTRRTGNEFSDGTSAEVKGFPTTTRRVLDQ